MTTLHSLSSSRSGDAGEYQRRAAPLRRRQDRHLRRGRLPETNPDRPLHRQTTAGRMVPRELPDSGASARTTTLPERGGTVNYAERANIEMGVES
jgi:hypothetical protein